MDKKESKDQTDNFIHYIAQSVKFLNQPGILPRDLLAKTFLTFFWEKFDQKNDLEEFLEGLTGSESQLNEGIEKIEEITNYMKTGDGTDFEKTARALEYSDEVLNPLAYPENFKAHGQSLEYKAIKSDFTNCAEESLFVLCDLILWQDGQFQTSRIPENSLLRKFYEQTRGTQKGLSKKIESSWNDIVENLDTSLNKDLLYAKQKDGVFYEIDPGLIRFMHVLKKISGWREEIPHINLPEDELRTKCQKWLKDFFEAIAPDERTFNVEINSLNKNSNSAKPDYSAVIQITMKKDNEELCNWGWEITAEEHAKIDALTLNSKFKNLNYENSKSYFLKGRDILPIFLPTSKNFFLRIFRDQEYKKTTEFLMLKYKEQYKNSKFFANFAKNKHIPKEIITGYEIYKKYISNPNTNLDELKIVHLIGTVGDEDFWRKNIQKFLEKLDPRKPHYFAVFNMIARNEFIPKDNLHFKNIELSQMSILKMIEHFKEGKEYEIFWKNNISIILPHVQKVDFKDAIHKNKELQKVLEENANEIAVGSRINQNQ
jgi:hypothetical protein